MAKRKKTEMRYKSELEGVTGPTGLLSTLVTVWRTLMARVAVSSLLTVATVGVLMRNTRHLEWMETDSEIVRWENRPDLAVGWA